MTVRICLGAEGLRSSEVYMKAAVKWSEVALLGCQRPWRVLFSNRDDGGLASCEQTMSIIYDLVKPSELEAAIELEKEGASLRVA